MRKLFLSIALLFICFSASYASTMYTKYHIGVSSGVAVSTSTFTNAIVIISSSNYNVRFDDMKFSCDSDATIEIAITYSTNVTGGYEAVIARVDPISVSTTHNFQAYCDVTCAEGDMSVGTVFRLSANDLMQWNENIGKVALPAGYTLIIRCKADTEGAFFYGQFRVFEQKNSL